jgi:hypothetical protein
MTHSFPLRRILAVSLAALALASGSAAIAESQYGYATATGATVTATARVNLSIVVPKLILLRVGTTTTGGDTLSWTADFGITPTPTVANNQNYAWTGAAPTTTTGTNPAVLASAWTNSSTGGSLSYVATDFAAGGPTLGNITVSSVTGSGAALNHPLPAALATASTTSTSFAANTLANSNWTFALAGTPATWRAGTYTSTVTYTATAL